MSAPDLISRAARFFVLAEQASRLEWWLNKSFWELSAPLVVEAADHLPAMTAAVRTVNPNALPSSILWRVASLPLPGLPLPEAVLWYNRLVAAWEVHRVSSEAELQNLARLALVRLDGYGMPDGQQRPSRLPEWLAEARKIVSGEWRVASGEWEGRPAGRPYEELQALAALAAWRPAPRVITRPETLREWVDFWLKMRQSESPVEKGIAAIALLNLPEADLRAASIPPVPAVELLRQLTTAIQVAVERTDQDYLSLLDWQPVKETSCPAAEVRNVAQAWLEVTRHERWRHRCVAWQQLIRWDRAGNLATCGMDLLPELVKAVPTERDADVLGILAQWMPGTERFTETGTPDRHSQLQQLESVWKRYRAYGYFSNRIPAWLAGIRLHQTGLAAEPPESFLKAYLSRVAKERDSEFLFILAQWSPGPGMPGRWHRDWHEAWQQRLLDKDERIRPIAAWALLRHSMEKESDRSLRCAALELWRAGTKASMEASHTPGAVFARLQEVQARLATGEVVDFEAKPARPSEQCRLPMALPPGRIAGGEWQMENEKLKMENEELRMKYQEATPNHRLVPDNPSR